MEIKIKVIPQFSANGQVYDATHQQEGIGGVWERPTSVDQAKRWVGLESPPGRFNAVLLPSGNTATIEEAKTDLQTAFVMPINSITTA
jgi:hypothetical protein